MYGSARLSVVSMTIVVGSFCNAAAFAQESAKPAAGVPTYSLAEAIGEVKRTKRPVFAVSYSDTCPVCQGLLKTLANEKSLQPIAAQFVNVRINVESPEFRSWERRYPRPSTAIPGVYLVGSGGEAIDLRAGGQSVDELRTMLTDALQKAGRVPGAEQLAPLRTAAEAARPVVAAGEYAQAWSAFAPVRSELLQFYDGLALSDEGLAIREVVDPIVADARQRLDDALASQADAWSTAWTIASLKGDDMPGLAAEIDAAETELAKDAAQKVMLRQATELHRARDLYGADQSERGRKALERIAQKYAGKPAARMATEILAGRAADATAADDGGFRTWHDRSEKFSIDARFDSAGDGKVRLRRRDGRVVEVPLDKLSDADRQFVAAQAAAF